MNRRMRIKKYLGRVIRRAVPSGTDVGFNVPLNTPTDDPSLVRVVRIQSLNEESEDRDEAPRIYKRTFGVTVECSYMPLDYSGQESDEENFEDFIELVLGAVVADDRLTDPEILREIASEPLELERSMFTGIEYRTEAEGARPIYSALLKFEFCYNLATGPEVGDDKADTFRATIVPGPLETG